MGAVEAKVGTGTQARGVERPDALARQRIRRMIIRLLLVTSAAVLLAALLLAAAAWVWWRSEPSEDQRSRGINALWAAHTWVGEEHREKEYEEFAKLLTRNEISDVFFHAGPLQSDGGVAKRRIDHAPALVRVMKRYAPRVRVQAYLGQVERRGGGPLNLEDADVRERIVGTAQYFLNLGFDGIHYDIEPIYPDDERFLDLLDETRDLTGPHGAVLSVALEPLELVPGAQRIIGTVVRRYHDMTRHFLSEVAARVDQIAIMTYDTGLPADWLFGAYTARQTEQILKTIGDDVTVFLGVPTYSDGTFFGFHPWAENMRSGIRGFRKGLGRLDRGDTKNVGVAVFAEWTTSEDDWDIYQEAWLGR